MNKNQYLQLTTEAAPELFRADASVLVDQTPRTLLYGYTCDRETWHVYLADGAIHKVVYGYPKSLELYVHQSQGLTLEDCVPNKRLYPEACDFEFCSLLTSRGINLPFTVWSDTRPPAAFHGEVVSDLLWTDSTKGSLVSA